MVSLPPYIHCPECGTIMRFEERPDVIRYKGRERHYYNECWWCPDCGESVLDGPALVKSENIFSSLRKDVDRENT